MVYRRYYSHSPIPSDGDFNDVANRSESCQFDARISFNRFKFRFNDIQVIVAFDIAIALAIGQDLQSSSLLQYGLPDTNHGLDWQEYMRKQYTFY